MTQKADTSKHLCAESNRVQTEIDYLLFLLDPLEIVWKVDFANNKCDTDDVLLRWLLSRQTNTYTNR